MLAMILIVLHLLICLTLWFLMYRQRISARYEMLPAVFMIPVFGILLLAEEMQLARRHQIGSKHIDLEKLKITDTRYNRIDVDTGKNQDITVPLEEAMLVNDSSVRRELMFDILHQNPEDYISLFQRTRMSSDVELTHYATTTMMEIQSRYELGLQELSERMRQQPDNLVLMKRYRTELDKYISSGLISGNILYVYRQQLDTVLDQIVALEPERKKYRIQKIENRIAMNELEGIEEELAYLTEKWPEDEMVYMLTVKYYYHRGQGAKIKEVLHRLKEDKVYLSHEGKRWYQFWNSKEETD